MFVSLSFPVMSYVYLCLSTCLVTVFFFSFLFSSLSLFFGTNVFTYSSNAIKYWKYVTKHRAHGEEPCGSQGPLHASTGTTSSIIATISSHFISASTIGLTSQPLYGAIAFIQLEHLLLSYLYTSQVTTRQGQFTCLVNFGYTAHCSSLLFLCTRLRLF